MERKIGLQFSVESWTGRMYLIWLSVLTMIYRFGRTTGHQLCNPESPFLALVRLSQHQKEKNLPLLPLLEDAAQEG